MEVFLKPVFASLAERTTLTNDASVHDLRNIIKLLSRDGRDIVWNHFWEFGTLIRIGS